jgi:hypothetical protein
MLYALVFFFTREPWKLNVRSTTQSAELIMQTAGQTSDFSLDQNNGSDLSNNQS